MTDKSILRVTYNRIRNSLTDRDQRSLKISQAFLNSDVYKNCDTVYAYYPIGSEVQVLGIIEQAFLDGKNVALPKCLDKNGTMEFYYIENLNGVTHGLYGIPEPTGEHTADTRSDKSVCLVPALAYDNLGYRLGYGGGYYDRFLGRFRGITVGLCYEACTTDSLPKEDTDRKVDIIITEKFMKIKEE